MVPNYLARLWYRLDKTYKVCQGIYNNYHSHCESGFVLTVLIAHFSTAAMSDSFHVVA